MSYFSHGIVSAISRAFAKSCGAHCRWCTLVFKVFVLQFNFAVFPTKNSLFSANGRVIKFRSLNISFSCNRILTFALIGISLQSLKFVIFFQGTIIISVASSSFCSCSEIGQASYSEIKIGIKISH